MVLKLSRLNGLTRTYEVPNPIGIQSILAPFVGGIFFLVGLLSLFQELTGKQNVMTGTEELWLGPYGVAGFFALMGALFLYAGLREFTGYPSEIHVYSNGTIEFTKPFGSSVIQVDDISSITLTLRALELEGEDNREIRIRHTNGTICVRHLHSAESFIASLTALNPTIHVSADEGYYGNG